jgi:FkbH-like protein
MIKLVIWDLDDTLWHGTLADGDSVRLFDRRAELICKLNQHGIVSSICSKNDPLAAREKLLELGLWDEFVFPRIAFEPKAGAISSILADMQLRAADVLFVDDNPLNLNEAQFHLPDLQVLDSRESYADAVLEKILTCQPASRNRLAEYRSLERKHQDRRAAAATTDEDFLRSCEIRACAPPMLSNLDFIERIVELINRSNQLNYTGSRVSYDSLKSDMIDGYLEYYSWSIFAWDKYGDHGLVGFVMVHRRKPVLKHFVFSCRVMHMGLESYALSKVGILHSPDLVILETWRDRFNGRNADWITDLCYENPETRQAVLASQGRVQSGSASLRIMHACQSAGLAHYSTFRREIDFDLHPGIFALRHFTCKDPQVEELPDFLVYGAATDYKDEVWPNLAHLLESGLYAQCVRRFCEYLAKRGSQALIILPPENLVDYQYGPVGLTWARTKKFNSIWRQAGEEFPFLAILDMGLVCEPHEFVDVNHLRPAALQTISSLMDIWFGHASGAPEGEWMEAA